jgi:hypothetical protein
MDTFLSPLRQILRGADRFVAKSRYSRIEVNRKTQKKLRTGIFGVNFAMSKGKNLKTAKKKITKIITNKKLQL